jgi:hypothetical protein
MNEIEIIKKQLKKINDLTIKNNILMVEDINKIKEKYSITEANSPRDIKRYDVAKSTEQGIEDEEMMDGQKPNEVSQGYRISGGILVIYGDDRKEVEVTTDDKMAFQETMDEFINEVSDMVNFGQLNLYSANADWSGLIVDFDLEFYFTIGESNGIYISGDMLKLDENLLQVVQKLQTYYEKFKSKWAKVIANRKKTKEKK